MEAITQRDKASNIELVKQSILAEEYDSALLTKHGKPVMVMMSLEKYDRWAKEHNALVEELAKYTAPASPEKEVSLLYSLLNKLFPTWKEEHISLYIVTLTEEEKRKHEEVLSSIQTALDKGLLRYLGRKAV